MSVGTTAVVTVVHGRHDHLVRQARSLARGSRRPAPWVVVGMADPRVPDVVGGAASGLRVETVALAGTDPAALPLARARNAGAARALSLGATTLVFLDVDCLAGPDLVGGYERAVEEEPGTVWSGPVTYLSSDLTEHDLARPWLLDDPHPARPDPGPGRRLRQAEPELFWSLSFALSADAWRRTGGFCEEYVGYGAEDTDFAFQVRRAGVELGWVGDARAYHQHHGTGSPAREHAEDIVRNGAVFARRWGWWPMAGWFAELEAEGLVARRDGAWQLTPSTGEAGRRGGGDPTGHPPPGRRS